MKISPIIIAILFSLTASHVRGQKNSDSFPPIISYFPTKDGKIYYEKVLSIDSTSKEEIYKRAKLWGLNAFVNTEKVNIFDEPEIGVIAFQGYIDKPLTNYKVGRIMVTDSRQIWITIKIYIKANKARIVFNDIKIKSNIHSLSVTIPNNGFWNIESFDETYKADNRINRDVKSANDPYFRELSQDLGLRLEALEIALKRKADDLSF